ncbi:MAG TPA: SpoIIE family protein phosphatase [Bryobacteraceae bacterium]|nr:SpoIIE family protein phosphatase [Bryobacteraceae bacterium]
MAFKILVVDDEPDVELLIRQKFRRKIRDGEFEFEFARNGEDALEKINADHAIDIVMSDINMPVMDGLTLLAKLAGLDRILRTVMVSAYGDMQNIRAAMNRGAYDFLTKPIDFEDFETTVQKTIREIRGVREGHQARLELTAIENELSVATQIQQSMLPKHLPDHKEFEVYAQMSAARSVGGDFYDFFFLDSGRLGLVIGDVSGKGVPAAIFMAVSRTLLRATAIQGVTAAACLEYVNQVLAKQSDSPIFVTLCYGILDIATGDLDYATAGHHGPIVSSPQGAVRHAEASRNLFAGMYEGLHYTGNKLKLEPGDALVLYTDGVTEAFNAEGRMFGSGQLDEAIHARREARASEIVQHVFREVKEFAGSAQQSDDITVLALRYSGPPA